MISRNNNFQENILMSKVSEAVEHKFLTGNWISTVSVHYQDIWS